MYGGSNLRYVRAFCKGFLVNGLHGVLSADKEGGISTGDNTSLGSSIDVRFFSNSNRPFSHEPLGCQEDSFTGNP